MNRAERRRRRDHHVFRRWKICFIIHGWDRDPDWQYWADEPGRLSKYNMSCACLMCRYDSWIAADRRKPLEDDLDGQEKALRKYNRIFRSSLHPLFRRGGKSGTRV
jgi:hypothetical protein